VRILSSFLRGEFFRRIPKARKKTFHPLIHWGQALPTQIRKLPQIRSFIFEHLEAVIPLTAFPCRAAAAKAPHTLCPDPSSSAWLPCSTIRPTLHHRMVSAFTNRTQPVGDHQQPVRCAQDARSGLLDHRSLWLSGHLVASTRISSFGFAQDARAG